MNALANINKTIDYILSLRKSPELKDYKKSYRNETNPITKKIDLWESIHQFWMNDGNYFQINVIDDYIYMIRTVNVIDLFANENTEYKYKIMQLNDFDNHFQLVSVNFNKLS